MPRQGAEPSISTRRSSRLNGLKPDVESFDAPSGRKKTRTKASAAKLYERPSGSRSALASWSRRDQASTSNSSVNPRRSLRISAEELARREAALLAREKEFDQKVSAQNQAGDALKQKEKEASMMMSRLADREAQATLSQLEQVFICPLCYDVFSAPHTLNAPKCGHTFCGLCILKWFFSRLHICGAWHESVDCPICRAVIQSPRSESVFPFIPNRLAATTIQTLTEKLSSTPANTAMIVKREENDDIPVASGSKSSRGRNCPQGAQAKAEEDGMPQTPDLDAWREGGHMRNEWLKKDREGKKEMADLHDMWRTLRGADLIALKKRLGV